MNFLGLSPYDCDFFLHNLNEKNLEKNELKTLNNAQKDFIIAMAVEILTCGGVSNDNEFMVAETVFGKIANINIVEFSNRIEKVRVMINHFFK